MKLVLNLVCLVSALAGLNLAAAQSPANRSFTNPVLPGWHSDPSCARSPDGVFLCVTSTFIAFPGLPVYASKDLLNWKLVSHVWSRESQLPGVSRASWRQMGGMYAPTIRYHGGFWWVICEYLDAIEGMLGVLFKTTDPFSDDAWSDPVYFYPSRIDPDLFWDDDGTLYAATQGIILQTLNPTTGALSQPPIELWNGTGGVWPEGPRIIKRGGWYYLLIAEGGTATNHAVTMARARNITGPYQASPHNPHLTNRGTSQFFQTVGHADLFQDGDGNWWGMCLATRSGPQYKHYPMGREAVLFPVKWDDPNDWPVMQPVRGRMEGPLPTVSSPRQLPGAGPFVTDDEDLDFTSLSKIPANLIYWRVPRAESFSLAAGRGLKMVPLRPNITGVVGNDRDLNGQNGLTFIGRRQTHTLFNFSIDLDFTPQKAGQEAGATVFLTQYNHIDISVVGALVFGRTPLVRMLRLRATALEGGTAPAQVQQRVPDSWTGPIRLTVRAVSLTEYELSASSVGSPGSAAIVLGRVSSQLVSGGTGQFVGALLGAFATCNGAGDKGVACPDAVPAYVTRWKYTAEGQHVAPNDISSPRPPLAWAGGSMV
ncbi:xylosidase/arabinosidase [Magnaporthiopsis poae ATCC 64411]|uniref:Xylosidase/arabinosidase n=1 Tax=Magnaporthiopsis poae (strain ATCC 64411 / 73-15) TaxID=644358 RepID=A0A0C4DZ45_MAGP6|nr:xylosidase/arabinosidase [Magnaporthiopsis poae ATCC 64411]